MAWDHVNACPLCDDSTFAEISDISYDRIREGLKDQWGATISDEVWKRHTPGTHAHLVECRSCKLQYFRGAAPADAEFYAELTHYMGYESERWEFAQARSRIGPKDSVVDFGAGRGDFLELLHAKRAVGVDYNAEAVQTMRDRGLEASQLPFRDFGEREVDNFTVATAFHVIEHVPDVSELLEAARQVLRSNGRLLISTPNRRRFEHTFAPLDCPPHHVSRWSIDQFEFLGDRFGFELTDVVYDFRTLYWYGEVQRHQMRNWPDMLSWAVQVVMWRTGLAQRYARWIEPRRHVEGEVMLAEYRIT